MHSERIKINKREAVLRFSRMIRYRTVENEDKELIKFQTALINMYPGIYNTCSREIINKGIVYHWKGKNSAKSIILMSHYDVVPAKEDEWTHPPFSGMVSEGRIWGRGTIDTKCTLAAVMESVEALIEHGFIPECDIYLCFGGDEESTGYSAAAICKVLNRRGVRPYLILDEGGAVVRGESCGINMQCALIGIAEKGYMDVEFTTRGNGGHTSLASAYNPLTEMSEAIRRINNTPFKFQVSEPLKLMINTASRHANLKYRALIKTYPLWGEIFSRKVAQVFPEVNALSRTIGAITQISGGSAANVIPEQVTAVGNFRIISGSSAEDTLAEIKRILVGLEIDIRVLFKVEPSKISKVGGEGWRFLCRAIDKTWSNCAIIPYLMLAGSDSRSYSDISAGIFRFSPIKMTKQERKSIHGIDESIEIKNYIKAIRFYINLITQGSL